jgi:hypothetical protein
MNGSGNLAQVAGDGGDAMRYEPDLKCLREAVEDIVADGKAGIAVSREEASGVRFAEWTGQSPDGLKHEEILGYTPEPFEGSTDSRILLSDQHVNEDKMLCLVAMLRSQVMVHGLGAEDAQKAGRVAKLVKWILNNELGIDWIRENLKLADYVFADTPGVGFLSIEWLREQGLEYQDLSTEDLIRMYVEMAIAAGPGGADPEQVQADAMMAADQLLMDLANPDVSDEDLAEFLQQFFEYLRPKTARKSIKELRANGVTRFPVPYTRYDGVRVEAHRLFEDVFFCSGLTTLNRAPVYFRVAWLSEPELWDRVATDGWRKSFVEKLLKSEAADAFSTYRPHWRLRHSTPQDYKRLYQVLYVYYEAVNGDMVRGKYYQTMSYFVDEFAHERRLLDYKHGEYPGVLFQREVVSKFVMDARGIPEVLGASQGLMKMCMDDFGDHEQISALPPMVTMRRGKGDQLYISRLRELQARNPNEYQWLKPPEYPRAAVDFMDRLDRQAREWGGRPGADVPPELVAMHREFKVLWWMAQVREAVRQVLSLYQQYLPEDKLARIVDSDGEPLFNALEDIRGEFDVVFSIDMRMFDPEYMANIGGIVRDVLLAIDRDKTIDPSPIVESMLYMLMPHVADKSLRPRDKALADEFQDEFDAYLKIIGGAEPELPDDGSINYEARLGMYQDMQEKNPQAFSNLPEDRQAILQSRLERMQVMAEQYGENVQIGREGGRRALG